MKSSVLASTAEPLAAVPGSFTPTNNMITPRASHSATCLTNGKVLIAGGDNEESNALPSAELYDPTKGKFSSATGDMTIARNSHSATLLANGWVLITGGADNNGNWLASAELYNPATGKFSSTGRMAAGRVLATATLLGNGMVLIAGGGVESGGKSYGSSKFAEVYDPATGTFKPTGSMQAFRSGHTATLLFDGKVLIAGGRGGATANSSSLLSSAEVYDPKAGTFKPTGRMAAARAAHSATLLNDGKILIAGGAGYSAELYSPGKGLFTRVGSMTASRNSPRAALLPSGRVLIIGGLDAGLGLASAELYDPINGVFGATEGMSTARQYFTVTVLPNAGVLVGGGIDDQGYTLNSAELSDPTTLRSPDGRLESYPHAELDNPSLRRG